MRYILIFLIFFSFSLAGAETLQVPGWKHIKTFSNGMLFAHGSAPKTTMTTWYEKKNTVLIGKEFKSKDYFEGLKFVREKGLALGGLKGWKLEKVLSETKNEKYIELVFRGKYLRASGEEVLLTEKHTFSNREFWQWQIVRDAGSKDYTAEDVAVFKRLSDEIIN